MIHQRFELFLLFPRPDDRRRAELVLMVDSINGRYGSDLIRFAISGPDRPWKLKAGSTRRATPRDGVSC